MTSNTSRFFFYFFSEVVSNWLCYLFFPPRWHLSLEILNLANGAAEQHGENHPQKLDNTDANSSGKDVGEVLMKEIFQLLSAALQDAIEKKKPSGLALDLRVCVWVELPLNMREKRKKKK